MVSHGVEISLVCLRIRLTNSCGGNRGYACVQIAQATTMPMFWSSATLFPSCSNLHVLWLWRVFLSLSVYMCIYIYIHMYVCVCTYIYIYILSSSRKRPGVFLKRYPSERQPRSCSSWNSFKKKTTTETITKRSLPRRKPLNNQRRKPLTNVCLPRRKP